MIICDKRSNLIDLSGQSFEALCFKDKLVSPINLRIWLKMIDTAKDSSLFNLNNQTFEVLYFKDRLKKHSSILDWAEKFCQWQTL